MSCSWGRTKPRDGCNHPHPTWRSWAEASPGLAAALSQHHRAREVCSECSYLILSSLFIWASDQAVNLRCFTTGCQDLLGVCRRGGR